MPAGIRVALVLWLGGLTAFAATFSSTGTTLTVSTATLQVTFSGAEITSVTNLLTGESYLRNPSSAMQVDLALVQLPSAPLAAVGSWMVNSAGTSAALTFTDSNRTISVTVSADPATQQIVIDLDGQAKQGGVEWLVWGITGFDMSAGQFVLPAMGGLTLNGASLSAASSYSFFHSNWEAPFLLFQGKDGGVNLYSTDAKLLCKNLTISPNFQQTANASIQVEAPGPWSTATEAGPIEWRLAAYAGDWQAGARTYRDWHNSSAPPAPLTGARAWVNNIRTVIEYADAPPYQNSTLDALAAVLNPAQTLLYLVDWRTNRYDVGYPDYNWDPSVPSFITHAHTLGFHVMLHTDALGVSPSSPDFAAVQQYQIKDALTLSPQGWNWNLPASTPNRYAIVNPAAPAWRQLFVARVTPAVQTLQADAIHLDFSAAFNDGNGLISGMNSNQGFAQLEQDLLTAFPGLVLGIEENFDAIAPRASFSQPLYWSSSGLSPAAVSPAPVSAYALPNVTRYWHLGTTDPNTAGFVPNLSQYEGQAVLPTLRTEISSYTQPDVARFMNVIGAFQKYNLAPAWDAAWNGAVVEYQGTGGVTAALTDTGSLVQFTLQQAGASSVLYSRAHGVNQIDSPLSVPNWPAFNGTVTLGLDPSNQYWLDTTPKPASLPHISSLPAGARLALGASTLVTPQFSYFGILPPASQSGFDFIANLWLVNSGVTYNGADYPLANGATANLQTMVVGGVSRQAILCQPPWMAQIGGETFLEYSVPVSSGGPSLSFAAGILDSDIGQRQGPMTFKVEINGAILWQQDVSTSAWQSGAIDMTPWAGLTVKIRLVSNPGPSDNPGFAGGGWSALELSSPAAGTLSGIVIAVPQGIASSNVATTGGTASEAGGNVTVNGLPPGGTVLVFEGQPAQVAQGQTLLNVPFSLAQGSNTQLASVGPPAYAGTGGIGPVTSGGITKQALNAFGPPNGQTIFSWLVQLPASALDFSFSAGFWDNVSPPAPQGFLMAVRINGQILWQRNINVPPAWQNGALDLSAWAGRTVLLELITDTQGPNSDDFTSWGDLTFISPASTSCAVSLSASGAINAPAAGASGTIPVTGGAGCTWSTSSAATWIVVAPSSGIGSGTVSYTIAPTTQARQSTFTVGGHVLSVNQAGASLPTIQAIVDTWNYTSGLAPGAWVAIGGMGLANGPAQTWSVTGTQELPVTLGDVIVTFNGTPAALYYVSSTLIDALVPASVAPGPVEVLAQVNGVSSLLFTINATPALPAIYALPNADGSVFYVTAALAGTANLVGTSSVDARVLRAAQPGDTLDFYVIGLGATQDPTKFITSQIFAAAYPISAPLTLNVGGENVPVLFGGLVTPGLYLVRATIPTDLPAGAAPIQISLNGVQTTSALRLTIQPAPQGSLREDR